MTPGALARAVSCLLLALVPALPLRGQQADPAVPQAEPAPAPSPRPARHVAAPTFALGAGGPLLASASAGVILGTDRAQPDECPSPRGWLLQAEGGVGGAKLGGGPVFTYCHTPFGSLGAGSVQAVWVRTWGRPLATEPDLSYVGGELDLGLIDWRVTLGLVKRTGDAAAGANWLFTWGIARGF